MLRVLLILLTVPALLAQPDSQLLAHRVQKQLEAANRATNPVEALKTLEAAEREFDNPANNALARDHFFVAEARYSIHLALAAAHAKAGHTAEAQKYVDWLAAAGCWQACARELRQEKAFQAAPFDAMLAALERHSSFWDSSAFDTPYVPNLGVEQKIAGLSRLWSEVKYNFVFTDRLVELDWDGLYLAWLPKVMATQSTIEYYRALQELCAKLRDGHTNVYFPSKAYATGTIPLGTKRIGDRVVIAEVYTQELVDQGFRQGQEIVEIDGVPAVQYGEQHVLPYTSASTPHALRNNAFGYLLFQGADRSVHLKVKEGAGNIVDRMVNRYGYKWDLMQKRARVETRILPRNIGYLAINDFGDDQIAAIDRAMPAVLTTDALVIDLRSNTGGSSGVGNHLMGYLTDQPFPISRQVVRHYIPTFRARGMEMDFVEMPSWTVEPPRNAHYSKPVVVLISPATASAAEDFCVSLSAMRRGRFVGQPTNGSTGQPLVFKLPGGGSARVCTKHDTFPDGRPFVGQGIQPDIPVELSVEDLRTNVDRTLEVALEQLRGSLR